MSWVLFLIIGTGTAIQFLFFGKRSFERRE